MRKIFLSFFCLGLSASTLAAPKPNSFFGNLNEISFLDSFDQEADKVEYLKSLTDFLRDSKNLEHAKAVQAAVGKSKITLQAIQRLRQDPEIDKLFIERYGFEMTAQGMLPKLPDFDYLRSLPAGTLGKEYANFLDTYKISPDSFEVIDGWDDLAYFENRYRFTHDLWHVVAGMPEVSGTMEVQIEGFYAAQVADPYSATIVAASVIQVALKHPLKLQMVMEAFTNGYKLGKRAKSLFAMRWEEMWERPLSEIKKELRIPLQVASRKDLERQCLSFPCGEAQEPFVEAKPAIKHIETDYSGFHEKLGEDLMEGLARGGFETNKEARRYARSFVEFVQNPGEITNFYTLHSAPKNHPSIQEQMAYLKSKPEIMATFERRDGLVLGDDGYTFEPINMSKLSELEKGSFGYIYYKFMTDRNLSNDHIPIPMEMSDFDYFRVRFNMTHDYWHLVSGFEGITTYDEIGIQVLYASQLSSTMAFNVISIAMSKAALQNPIKKCVILAALEEGLRIGRKAKNLLGVRWEKEFRKPMSELRAELGIDPARSYEDVLESCQKEIGGNK